MKVALVIFNAEPTRGGTERYTHELARSLVARGHDVYIVATRFARSVEPAKQVHLDGAAGGRLKRYRLFNRSLQEHLDSTKYDIVHAMLPVSRCDIYQPHAGIEAHNFSEGYRRHEGRVRQVISKLTNQLNAKRRLYADVERELLEVKRAAVLCLSHAMQQIVDDHYDLNEDQVYTLLHGVDLAAFDNKRAAGSRDEVRRQYGLNPDDVVALLMSNNLRLKGLRQAMQALRVIAPRDPRVKLLVVGSDETDDYRRLAQQMGIEQSVVFAGPTDEPARAHAAADLLVLPTAYDSCGLVILESLAMGRPVITTRSAGASEMMSDGVQGFVIDSQADVEALIEGWAELLNDSLRQKMSESAIALRPKLSMERHVDGLLQIYQSVLSR